LQTKSSHSLYSNLSFFLANELQSESQNMESVGAEWSDFIAEPIKFVNKLYDQVQGQSTNGKEANKQLLEFHESLKQQVNECVQDESKRNMIPFLNGRANFHDALRNRSLVRYQCMVQDMFNPEVYTAAVRAKDKNAGDRTLTLYSDANLSDEEVNAYDSSNVILDRYVYYAISVPGVNEWVQECWLDQARQAEPSLTFKVPADSPDKSTAKRFADLTVAEESQSSNPSSSTDPQASAKKQKVETTSDDSKATNGDQNSKSETEGPTTIDSCYPIAAAKYTNRPCIVKVYDDQDPDVKLNDLIEVIGIIEFEDVSSLKSESTTEDSTTTNEELQQMLKNLELESEDYFNYPYSLVPRLHALTVTHVTQLNPLPAFHLPSDANKVNQLKVELHGILTQALFGDSIAAEYFICWLISTVYSRKDVLAIGNFPINLSKIPGSDVKQIQSFVRQLYALVQRLCSHSHLLPLSIRSLNENVFTPARSKNGSKLKSGLLQLPSNTMLVIDETALEPGKLHEFGLNNFNALKELILWQSVQYNELFYAHKINSNVNVLVLSEGKSLLEMPCQVPIQVNLSLNLTNFKLLIDFSLNLFEIKAAPTAEMDKSFAAVNDYLVDSLLSSVRRYISSLRDVKYEIATEVQQQIQTDFVKMRQKSNEKGAPKISSDDLHLFLNFARLLTLSSGSTVLTMDFWEKTVQFETERRNRLMA
jgi:hypothetical protein